MKRIRIDKNKLKEQKQLVKDRIWALKEAKILTKRQAEIVELVCMGYRNIQIAEKFKLVERTVEYHRNTAYGRLKATNAVELLYNMMTYEIEE